MSLGMTLLVRTHTQTHRCSISNLQHIHTVFGTLRGRRTTTINAYVIESSALRDVIELNPYVYMILELCWRDD